MAEGPSILDKRWVPEERGGMKSMFEKNLRVELARP
jgi:hypothetical protein